MQPQTPTILNSILALGFFFLVGCGNPPPPKPAPPPFAGTTLRISCPDGPARAVLDRHAAAWAQLQKVTLTFSDAKDADLIAFVPADLGRLVESGLIVPLPQDTTAGDAWTGYLRLYRNKLGLWGATPYALPILGDATVLIYRSDLFQAAKRKPPATFTEFTEVAQQFFGELKRPVLPALPADEDGLDRLFHTLAAAFAVTPVGENEMRSKLGTEPATAKPFSFHRDTATGSPRINDRGFIAALDWLKSMQPLRAKAGTVAECFTADDAVMGIGSLLDLAALKPGQNPGRYAVAPIPAGPAGERIPYIGPGGAMLSVAKTAKNPTAALALAKHLSSASVSLEIVHEPAFGSGPFRTVHLVEHRNGWFNYGLDNAGTAALLEAVRTTAEPRIVNAPLRLRTPDQAIYRAVQLDAVRKCLTTNGDATATLNAVEARWRELDAANPADRTAIYLRSLTLTQ